MGAPRDIPGEARIARNAANAIRAAITLAGGNEVCFTATVGDDGVITHVKPISRGNVESVLALPGFASPGDMLLHNHPSGLLEPSDADMEIAFRMHESGIGFGIVDNSGERLYVVAEVPPQKAETFLESAAVDAMFGPNGGIATAMHNRGGLRRYEDRPAQRQMAAAVADAFNSGGIAVLEAGTGVGKSLGYLVPALKWAALNGERTVVSTNTITLQEQLVRKDLPFLREAMPDQSVRFALLKGWRNYLCLSRLEQARNQGALLFDESAAADLRMIEEWSTKTTDGSLSDLPVAPRPEVWDEVAAEPDLCNRMNCPHYEKCFVFRARREAAQADIVVANHHLLLSDVSVRRAAQNWGESAVLPAYRRLVIDEGHNLEDAAYSHLGMSATWRGLQRLFSRLERRGRGLLPALTARLSMSDDLLSAASMDIVQEQLNPSLAASRDRASQLFELLRAVLDDNGGGVVRLTEAFSDHYLWSDGIEENLDALINEMKLMNSHLALIRERFETESVRNEDVMRLINELRAVGRRLDNAGDALVSALRTPRKDSDFIRWMEYSGRMGRGSERNVALHCVPLDLAPVLREDLFDRVGSAVVTSATLAAGNGFEYVERRLGLENGEHEVFSARYPSPFDFRNQALLVLPRDLPAPNRDPAAHFDAVARQLRDLVAASDGGAFALFTSHRDVRQMADRWRRERLDARWPLLVHGESPREQLLHQFRESGRAVLVGTATFWEGVDIPGDTLRALLIAKIPFRVPTEPIVAAQCEAIEASGGSAFREYMLPNAALRLKQGFGRLIRSTEDRGVVVISDPRVLTHSYGEVLLRDLPPARRISGNWEELRGAIDDFYAAG